MMKLWTFENRHLPEFSDYPQNEVMQKKQLGVRFAPSPTGRFHVGNLRTAWISHEIARRLQNPWIVRFEDIDAPRVAQGACEQQLADMKSLGLTPDEVHVQTASHSQHYDLFLDAIKTKHVYPCDCSRKDVQAAARASASAPHSAPAAYSGHCRTRNLIESTIKRQNDSITWRFAFPNPTGHDDIIVARTNAAEYFPNQVPSSSSFVPSYHWACALDDYFGDYRVLVRAWDLESSAGIQRQIQKWLFERDRRPPAYTDIFHTALITQNDGHRLEKRTHGVTLPDLEQNGVDAHALTQLFRVSFDKLVFSGKDGYDPGIFGETKKTLTLVELGL